MRRWAVAAAVTSLALVTMTGTSGSQVDSGDPVTIRAAGGQAGTLAATAVESGRTTVAGVALLAAGLMVLVMSRRRIL